jgi:hypothetical protein
MGGVRKGIGAGEAVMMSLFLVLLRYYFSDSGIAQKPALGSLIRQIPRPISDFT